MAARACLCRWMRACACAPPMAACWQAPAAPRPAAATGAGWRVESAGRSGETHTTPPLGSAAAWLRLDGQCADGSLTLRLGDAGADIGRVLVGGGWQGRAGKVSMAYACLALNESRALNGRMLEGIWPMLMEFLGDFTALDTVQSACFVLS